VDSDVDAAGMLDLLFSISLVLEQEHEHLGIALQGVLPRRPLQEVVVVFLGVIDRLLELWAFVHEVDSLLSRYTCSSARRADDARSSHRFNEGFGPGGIDGKSCGHG
jgi:hypothetical protein